MKDIKSPLRDIYKREFKKALVTAVGLHKQIGFKGDHPSYLQYDSPRLETPKELGLDLPSYEEQRKAGNIILFFKSSQCDFHIWFTITDPTPEEVGFLNSEDAYEYFRTIKYEILNALDYGNKRLEEYGNASRNGTLKEHIQKRTQKTSSRITDLFDKMSNQYEAEIGRLNTVISKLEGSYDESYEDAYIEIFNEHPLAYIELPNDITNKDDLKCMAKEIEDVLLEVTGVEVNVKIMY